MDSGATYSDGAAADRELESVLRSRVWRFGRGDGSCISSNVTLLRRGELVGHPYKNESEWRVNAGALEFLNDRGVVTCRFDAPSRDERGGMLLRGPFLPNPRVMHVLREVGLLARRGPGNGNPRVALLVRTHVVNEKLFDLLDVLDQSQRYDLFVLADETCSNLDFPGYVKCSHSADSCAPLGLCTDHPRILWHCGDYPLYFAAEALPGYDYYAMIEYDVDLVRRTPLFLEGLFARLHDGDGTGPDFLCPGPKLADDDWCWAKAARRIFPEVYTSGIFAFVVSSARAVRYLLAARREEARRGVTGDDIVHCEAFCASALIAGDYDCRSVNSMIVGAVDRASFHAGDPENPEGLLLLDKYTVADRRVELAHPVFDLHSYLERHYSSARDSNRLEIFLAKLGQFDRARKRDADIVSTFARMAAEELRRNAFSHAE